MQREYNELIEDFVKLLKEGFSDRLVSVALFGSVARERAKKESDIDLCIVIKDLPMSRFQRNRLISTPISSLKEMTSYKRLRSQGYLPDIAPILYTPGEIKETKPIFLDIVDEGEILLDDGTLKNKLEDIRKKMKAYNSRKITLKDGTWYWLLKPGMKLGEVIEL
ncbi:MAG: nucleotidyltransferase domain-containing protein [Nitrospirae bacterium]|nr:nucleotidyltransferase domain-containing protein [Nitrospirota bacterium]